MRLIFWVVPAVITAYCCAYTITCIGMYLDHRRYQPIYYVADVLHVYAIASAWFFLDWDTVASHMLTLLLHGFFISLALLTIRNTDSFYNTYYDDTFPFDGVRQSTFNTNENVHAHNARVAVVWIALTGSLSQMAVAGFYAVAKQQDDTTLKRPSAGNIVLAIVLTLCVFVSVAPYPRFSRVDSPHTTLIVGLVLALKPSFSQTCVLLIGIVFSVLYTIGYMNDCAEGNCFHTTYQNDRHVYREPEWKRHTYEEVSWWCFGSSISLIAASLFLYFHNLILLRYEWISCLEKFNKNYRMC